MQTTPAFAWPHFSLTLYTCLGDLTSQAKQAKAFYMGEQPDGVLGCLLTPSPPPWDWNINNWNSNNSNNNSNNSPNNSYVVK